MSVKRMGADSVTLLSALRFIPLRANSKTTKTDHRYCREAIGEPGGHFAVGERGIRDGGHKYSGT